MIRSAAAVVSTLRWGQLTRETGSDETGCAGGKLAALTLATGLATAPIAAAFIAPDRAAAAIRTRVPAGPSQIVATVPRGARFDLARADIERQRTLWDPRDRRASGPSVS